MTAFCIISSNRRHRGQWPQPSVEFLPPSVVSFAFRLVFSRQTSSWWDTFAFGHLSCPGRVDHRSNHRDQVFAIRPSFRGKNWCKSCPIVGRASIWGTKDWDQSSAPAAAWWRPAPCPGSRAPSYVVVGRSTRPFHCSLDRMDSQGPRASRDARVEQSDNCCQLPVSNEVRDHFYKAGRF